ncbi:hypothetical protein PoB_006640100 [Plakobranchus ocellatus]|uniref:Uncharacterized protein n=1 Tax=Plakobranchus ocellatus TaxID=259542 RepID=A0AAV4D6U7_9GAST|nr:hypothetical protein PoB_006640100 [Plakobranchus ocellatus]
MAFFATLQKPGCHWVLIVMEIEGTDSLYLTLTAYGGLSSGCGPPFRVRTPDDNVERDNPEDYGAESCYTLRDTRRLYLTDDISVCKMHEMFCQLHLSKNVLMGAQVRMSSNSASAEQLAQLNQERELHLRKACVFYDCKTAAQQTTKADTAIAAIVFDYGKKKKTSAVPMCQPMMNINYYRR